MTPDFRDQPPTITVPSPKSDATAAKLPAWAHLLCGWPLVLIAIGGAIGGGLGGAAYGINIAIYKSSLPLPLKIILNIITGLAAALIWLAAAIAIQTALQKR